MGESRDGAVWYLNPCHVCHRMVERMAAVNQLDVFISSTCYDLPDLRAEVGSYLEANGFHVRLSEDPRSAFYVDPGTDSIETCLSNVEASDVVVCIIDRRYGPPLTGMKHDDISATEAEVRHARELKPPKPVFFFIRQVAYLEYHQLRKDPNFTTEWVEKRRPDQAQRWTKFVDYAASSPSHGNRSNWCDQFKNVVDLKPHVLARLTRHFPEKAVSLALKPDRLVRVSFFYDKTSGGGKHIYGHYTNVGVGPAISLVHGYAPESLTASDKRYRLGGLAERDSIRKADGQEWNYHVGEVATPVIYCEYENRFGDRYRVELSFRQPPGERYFTDAAEVLFVALPAAGGTRKWVRAN